LLAWPGRQSDCRPAPGAAAGARRWRGAGLAAAGAERTGAVPACFRRCR
jgi:hypothetical protein